jgi:uncharacterized protein (TIGR03382 family)
LPAENVLDRVHHRSMRRGTLVLALALAAPACATRDDHVSIATEAVTSCSTEVVIGLSTQIADEVDCLLPGQMVPFAEGDGVVFTGTVLPYIDAEAKADLLAVAATGEVDVNSAYRTVAQQYLLYQWWQAGSCGITAAAVPGSSNHESGRAVDLDNWDARVDAMSAHGWSHDVPGDDVHFDHLASPDIRGSDVQAFQRLWNLNHPDELIDEDGQWGPMTESALARAPADGFAIGPDCDVAPDPEKGDPPGLGGDASGGCSTSGGGGGGGLVVAIGAWVRSRRRGRPAARSRDRR